MENNELKQKKSWLDHLYYDLGQQKYDFELAGTFKGKDGEIGFSKWKKYSECVFPIEFDGKTDNWEEVSFFKQINQRQILPIEIVLDLEEKETLPSVIQKLKDLELTYKVFSTGSRGYHIHIFFKEKCSQKEKLKLIKYCGGDEQKDGNKCLIALEYAPHWKSGKLKEEYNGN